MKIKLICDSGANITSARSEVVDTEKMWGLTDEEWNEMSEDDKYKLVEEWAWERLNILWEEV